ncbi:N-acetylglucosamine-1-phosphotransferase subunits alpha/beta-like isoform X2 [Mercenaria mercenaria]|uniref:N-acetylglucosamine-1-phosphotransferase subunits alpha/beta-like isoform X2 n=1 Tax=Mercenaria mercenaria TaxID=6596 RepID=UPI00234E7ACA|nr:N-acetylglucosamine-1-phosphotransferase subunits alpha/beta-like isoform X2 [Mercenaria mercenaria]
MLENVPVQSFSKPVDLVLTWVNGSDQSFIEEMLKFKPMSTKIEPKRYRDLGTLRYALRSVEKYANWFRHVYIVTNGQVPSWLNLNNQRVSIVKHSEIFRNASHLPTFNAQAIDCHIHNIQGLAQHFIYMNDDIFFANPVELADFYTNETGFKIRFGAERVPDCSDKCRLSDMNNGICDSSCNISFCEWDGGDCNVVATETNQESIIKHYGSFYGSLVYTSLAYNKAFGYVHRNVPAHVPHITDIAIMNELQNRFPEEWARTSANRFRDPHSFQHAFAFYHFLLRPRRNECGGERTHPIATTYKGYEDYTYSATGNSTKLEKALTSLLRKRHKKFACINDHMGFQNDDEVARNRKVIFEFFEDYFPEPSSFEVL